MIFYQKPALEDLGISDCTYGLGDEVRFSEIDALNHVNNLAYFRWAENYRIKTLPHYGVTDFSRAAPKPVVRAQSITYLAPMRLHQRYIIAGRHTRLGRSSFDMRLEVFSLKDARAEAASCRLEVSLVLMDADVKHAQPLTPQMIENIAKLDGLTI